MATGGPPRGGEFLIRDGYVLSMDPEIGDLPRGDVHVRDGAIVAVGEQLDAPGATVIDAADKIVMPGFVDTHWHLWNTTMRAFIVDGDPERSYMPVTKGLGAFFTPSDTYRATRLALVEAIRSGITTVHDWSHNVRSAEYADTSIRALLDAGVRGRFSYGYSQGAPLDVPMDVAGIAEIKERWFADPGTTRGLLHLGVASRNLVLINVRGSITIEMAHLDWDAARELGLPITLHANPAGLVTTLNTEGLLGPDVLLVHPTQTTAAENQIVAEVGAAWSIAPIQEGTRGPVEQTRFHELSQAGALLGLSIDSSANDRADFFAAMLILHKLNSNRLGPSTGVTFRRMIELATIEGAHSLGLGEVTGSLTPGKRADVILVNRLDPNMAPPGDPVTQLVAFGTPTNVDTVMADGRILLSAGVLVDTDVEQVVRDAQQSATEVSERAGWPLAS